MLFGVLLLAAAAPTSSSARDAAGAAPPPVVELWHGFTTATPKAEVVAFAKSLPKRRYALYPGCDPVFGYRYIKGRLVSITLVGLDRTGECTRRIREDMTAQHGSPVLGSGVQAAFSGTGYGSVGHDDLTWKLADKRVALYLIGHAPISYTYVFTVRPDEFLY